MTELYYQNSKWILVVNHFLRKSFIFDVCQGPKYAYEVDVTIIFSGIGTKVYH